MLSREWKETSEGIVRLPELDVRSWALYLRWVYTGKVRVPEDEDKDGPQIIDMKDGIRLWGAADQYEIPLLHNQVMNELVLRDGILGMLPNEDEMELAWNLSGQGSTLQRFLLDVWVSGLGGQVSFLQKYLHAYPEAFIDDFWAELDGLDQDFLSHDRRHPRYRGRCHYHVHHDSCPECKGVREGEIE